MLQLHVTRLDPSQLPHDLGEQKGQDGGEDETAKDEAYPHHGGMLHSGDHANGTYEAAGAHAGGYTGTFKLEEHGGQGADDGGGQGRGDPD